MGYRMHIGSIRRMIIICIIAACATAPAGISATGSLPLREKYAQSVTDAVSDPEKAAEMPDYAAILGGYEAQHLQPADDRLILLSLDSVVRSSTGDIPAAGGIAGNSGQVLKWTDNIEWFEWQADIPEEGLYEIAISYCPLPGNRNPVERAVMIDGKVPFQEAGNIVLPRLWRDNGEIRNNKIGNEVNPGQVEVVSWNTASLTDVFGMYPDPLLFHFSKGIHILRMVYVDQPVAIESIILKSPKKIPDYAEVRRDYQEKGLTAYTGDKIKFQAETSVLLKNDPTLIRFSESDPKCEPVSAGVRKLNTMGGWSWKKGSQSISWEFQVPEDGLYKLALRNAQWESDGWPSYRQIAIDGEIPFSEMKAYKFAYDLNWQTEILQDENKEPYLFFLTAGRHEIKMTVRLGEMADIVRSNSEDIKLLSKMIRQIIMITGSEPDVNFDYQLPAYIPDLLDNFMRLSASIKEDAGRMLAATGRKIPTYNSMIQVEKQIDEMIADPESITRKFNNLTNIQTTLGTIYLNLQIQALYVDYFLIGSPAERWENAQANIIEKIGITVINFMASFTKDYDSIGLAVKDGSVDKPVLDVWISRGKEWAETIKELADDDFVASSGIEININTLPASQLDAGAVNVLMLSIASGNAPDIACGVSYTSPVEFAIRTSVVDLNRFKDFADVTQERFIPKIMIPFQYMGGCYALPETMNFRALFYRRDIVDEIGISLPDTWNDLYVHVLPILYQNGMSFYYPQDFTPFLFQNNGSYYNSSGSKTGLDTPEALKAFKEYTELYTSYNIPVVANFFNRFRSGEQPLGVEGYLAYVQLSTAAPELKGKWGIAPVPGHMKPDGTIDRSVGGIAAEACMIMSNTVYPEEAWKFLKWWTDAGTQANFGASIESKVGPEARWNTANKTAFVQLPWNKGDLEVITKQWEWAKEVPIVLGGYFTNRHMVNAWNRVVLGNTTVRDSLETAVKDINKELKNKQEEYGVILSD